MIALQATVGLSLVLAGTAAARLLLPPGNVSGLSLLVYEVSLCVLAGGLLAGLLVAPWQRAAITDLVVELGEAHSGTLRGQLSRALGDPSLELGYWLPDRAVFIDAGSRTLSLGAAVRLALENERLQAEALAQLDQLRASRVRIVETGDSERRRLERDLHDGAQQRLLALSYDLRLAHTQAETDGDSHTGSLLTDAIGQAKAALGELRDLAHGICPSRPTSTVGCWPFSPSSVPDQAFEPQRYNDKKDPGPLSQRV